MKQRERILGCACDLFVEAGLDGFSLRELARRLGITAPALYRHFDSREDLLLAVVGEAFDVIARYLYRALTASSPAERLRMAGFGYLEFALENPRYYEVFHASPGALGMDQFPPQTVAQACAIGQFWKDRVSECMDAGVFRVDDPERVSVTMWALAHGLISLYLRGNLDMDEQQFRDFYIEAFVRSFVGLGADEYRSALLKAVPAGGAPDASPEPTAGPV
jgi:AcrR family transcriptional regulator